MKWSVVHRNGSGGVHSEWLRDAQGLTFTEADKQAEELERTAADGWKAQVRVVTDEEAQELLRTNK